MTYYNYNYGDLYDTISGGNYNYNYNIYTYYSTTTTQSVTYSVYYKPAVYSKVTIPTKPTYSKSNTGSTTTKKTSNVT
jgi:hypothetical protein